MPTQAYMYMCSGSYLYYLPGITIYMYMYVNIQRV